MRLSELLAALVSHHDASAILSRPAVDPEITAPISEDDRLVEPGGIFLARKGGTFDGHERIPQAIERGAAAIIGERPPSQVQSTVPYVQIKSTQFALGLLAAAWNGYPSRKLIVIGVTGTDGKTTTTNLIYHILKAAGVRVGMISTVNAVIGDQVLDTGLHVTTPSAPDIQGYLRRMVEAGLTHCVLETTSHGLAQGRVRGVDYDIAVLTNVTHEHLDFHGTWDAYRDAKADLFRQTQASKRKAALQRQKYFILNADDPSADYFTKASSGDQGDQRGVQYYSLNGSSQFQPCYVVQKLTHAPDAMQIEVAYTGRKNARLQLSTRMVGDYNAANLLAAVGAVAPILNQKGDWKGFNTVLQRGLDAMPPIPGRMERINEGQDYLAIVDFAHTPNALRRALEAARTLVPADRRVICVFGCAGLRDRDKRRLMPEHAIRLADVSVFTAEDPRTESLDEILETMAEAARAQGGVEKETFWRVRDRGQALAFACQLARPGDLVIACGKGHEQSMAFGTTEYAWDDRDALRSAIRGVPLRTLPTADNP
jgi:UDP-N-acetylmuramoyl-L-alanyl-D-glutamate--2,6-diaminopimelate ligase